MSKSKLTRSIKVKEESDVSRKLVNNSSVPSALRKIFYISRRMLTDDAEKLNLERFYHPGKGKLAWFITKKDKHIMEILEFAEPRRSWLIDNEVCSNGRIYFTTPIDVTFLALYHLRKHCTKRALSLDSIHDENDQSVAKILNSFVDPANLICIADVKTVDENMSFYKYNHTKAMAWLSLKTKRIAKALKINGIYCGNSAVSRNFIRSEKAIDETAQDTDYLRMACDYVGGYIALEMYEELWKRLKIPSEIQAVIEEKNGSNKRKSGGHLKSTTKKQKLQNETNEEFNSDLIEECLDKNGNNEEEVEEESKFNNFDKERTESRNGTTILCTPLKERPLSAKEKSLAKSAKGTKSISSFFIKKIA